MYYDLSERSSFVDGQPRLVLNLWLCRLLDLFDTIHLLVHFCYNYDLLIVHYLDRNMIIILLYNVLTP